MTNPVLQYYSDEQGPVQYYSNWTESMAETEIHYKCQTTAENGRIDGH